MLTADRLRELLHYDPETGLFTRKIMGRGRGNYAPAGSPIGADDGVGYLRAYVAGRSHRLHRLAWMHYHGQEIPEGYWIDHINSNKSDNRIRNLRLATVSENTYNKPMQSNNSSGFKGVYWHSPSGMWQAKIGKNRRSRHIGLFSTKEEAARAYDTAALQLFGEFARTNEMAA